MKRCKECGWHEPVCNRDGNIDNDVVYCDRNQIPIVDNNDCCDDFATPDEIREMRRNWDNACYNTNKG